MRTMQPGMPRHMVHTLQLRVRARLDETRGADRRLAERQPAVVGGHFGVGEHDKACVAQCRGDALEQNAVLEGAARQARPCRSAATRVARAASRSVASTSASRQAAVEAERHGGRRQPRPRGRRRIASHMRRRIELQEARCCGERRKREGIRSAVIVMRPDRNASSARASRRAAASPS